MTASNTHISIPSMVSDRLHALHTITPSTLSPRTPSPRSTHLPSPSQHLPSPHLPLRAKRVPQTNAQNILQILGWAARLMRYYKDASPIEDITLPSTLSTTRGEQQAERGSKRQAEIAEATVTNLLACSAILCESGGLSCKSIRTILSRD